MWFMTVQRESSGTGAVFSTADHIRVWLFLIYPAVPPPPPAPSPQHHSHYHRNCCCYSPLLKNDCTHINTRMSDKAVKEEASVVNSNPLTLPELQPDLKPPRGPFVSFTVFDGACTHESQSKNPSFLFFGHKKTLKYCKAVWRDSEELHSPLAGWFWCWFLPEGGCVC